MTTNHGTGPQQANDYLVLISGESGSGKSASLMQMTNPEGVLYLNCEAGKKLPFRSKFDVKNITDPYQIYEAFDYTQLGAPGHDFYHTIVVDTITFLMEMFESMYVIGSSNTMQGWANYQQFFKNLMQDKVAKSNKNVIFMGHTLAKLDEKAMEMKTSVPVKGALQNNGIEAYFSLVVSTKKMALSQLEKYKSNMLNITPDEEMIGYKHVFQTRLTKTTTGERIRSPLGMFSIDQTYIDNNAQMLMDHIRQYYES
jgi:hypothetical protein